MASASAEQAVKKLARLPSNTTCPNCGTTKKFGFGTVCIKYLTFVCNNCKSSHQAISHRCKSLTMSSWTDGEVLQLKTHGNDHARATWLGHAPPCGQNGRPQEGDPIDVFKRFIVDAYERKKYYSESGGGAASAPPAYAPTPEIAPAPISAPLRMPKNMTRAPPAPRPPAPAPAPIVEDLFSFDVMSSNTAPVANNSATASHDPFAPVATPAPTPVKPTIAPAPVSAPLPTNFDPFNDMGGGMGSGNSNTNMAATMNATATSKKPVMQSMGGQSSNLISAMDNMTVGSSNNNTNTGFGFMNNSNAGGMMSNSGMMNPNSGMMNNNNMMGMNNMTPMQQQQMQRMMMQQQMGMNTGMGSMAMNNSTNNNMGGLGGGMNAGGGFGGMPTGGSISSNFGPGAQSSLSAAKKNDKPDPFASLF